MADTKTELWHLRYRDTKMVENTLLEVDYVNGEPPTEKEATEVGMDYIAQRAEPTLRFIGVRKAIANSSREMKARRTGRRRPSDD